MPLFGCHRARNAFSMSHNIYLFSLTLTKTATEHIERVVYQKGQLHRSPCALHRSNNRLVPPYYEHYIRIRSHTRSTQSNRLHTSHAIFRNTFFFSPPQSILFYFSEELMSKARRLFPAHYIWSSYKIDVIYILLVF